MSRRKVHRLKIGFVNAHDLFQLLKAALEGDLLVSVEASRVKPKELLAIHGSYLLFLLIHFVALRKLTFVNQHHSQIASVLAMTTQHGVCLLVQPGLCFILT